MKFQTTFQKIKMNRINVLFFLISNTFFAQVLSIEVESVNNNLPIEGVMVYDGINYLGSTDDNGQISIKENVVVLKFIKEGFYDFEIQTNKIKEPNLIVTLSPISIIALEEVILTASKEDIESILEKLKKARYEQTHRNGKYYQSKVELKKENDVLFYFNNLIHLLESLNVNDNNKIVYNGKRLKNKHNQIFELFEINDKEIRIPVQSTVYCSLGQHELTPIFEGKLYNYILEKSDAFYLLRFSPKKKKSTLLYEGYFVLDKYDFGIIELQMKLVESKNNQWSTFDDNKRKYSYQVQQDEFSFKFSKFENKYFLENSSRIMKCVQTEGNHIDTDFDFRFYNEETMNHNGLDFRPFDFTLNKFKS
jgi:hypothetical protein